MLILPTLGSGVVVGSAGEVPLAQVGNPKIDFGMIENQPSSGNQAEEFVQLTNNNSTSVDISGWTMSSGEMEMTFKGGTVIPAGMSMYVAANKPAFKTRTEGPSGGQRLFVIGNYDGNLSNAGGTISLVAPDGEVVNTQEFTGEVSEVKDALVVSEINYNPLDPSGAELAQNVALDPEDFEFVEVLNVSNSAVSLDGVKFSNGIEFDFSGSSVQSLAAGERVLVVKDLDAFTLRYGADAAARVAGEFAPGTGLGNAGETITLLDAGNSIVADFRYDTDSDTGWPARADGRGSSLVFSDVTAEPGDGLSWIASPGIGGSPGAADLESILLPQIVINEVLANSANPVTDSIELLNLSDRRVTLEHFYLSDSNGTIDSLARFSIPASPLDPLSYLVLDESDFNADGNGFAFSSSNGETIYLTAGDANGPTHFVDTVSFGATAPGETYGRINGTSMFAPMAESTLGVYNSDARVGPVVVTEIQRDAGDPSEAALAIYPALDGGDLEFIELHNPQTSTVVLNNWRIRGGVDMTFDGEMLEPGETIVVVSFAADREDNADRTAACRAHYGLADDVKIVGGYANQLNNDRDRVSLQRPGAPADDGSIPRLLEDEVIYSDTGAWQSESGNSLQRVSAIAYGNDPLNWTSQAPTPGDARFSTADMNSDGSVTADDIQVVCAGIAAQDLMEYDFTRDGQLSFADLDYFVRRVVGTTFGDSNVDGKFDSTDLTLIFQAGQYEDGAPGNSTWATGDWNCDGEFTTRDLVTAFMYGDYDGGAAAARPAVESSSSVAGAIEASVAANQVVGVDGSHAGESVQIAVEQTSRPLMNLEGRAVDSVFADPDHAGDQDGLDDKGIFDGQDWQSDII